MDIVEALKNRDHCITISNHPDKWLAYNEVTGDFEVYYKPYCAKKTRVLLSTDNLARAIDRLVED